MSAEPGTSMMIDWAWASEPARNVVAERRVNIRGS
jgi:hypothetical protein